MFTTLLNIVGPVFAILALGYGAARWRFVDQHTSQGLARFVFNFAIPSLLFRSLADAQLPPQVPWNLLLSYYPAALTVFALGMVGSRLLWHQRQLPEQAIRGFAAAFSNAVLMGIPLVLTAFGNAAALPLFLLIAFHSPLLFTLVTTLIESGQGRRGAAWRIAGDTVRGLLRNPIFVGLVLGLGWNLLGLSLPIVVDHTLRTLGQAALPGALFAMGAALSRQRLAGRLPEAAYLVLLKLVVHPLLVWLLAAQVFQLPTLWTHVAVLLAAMPSGINPYLFAERYQVGVATVSTSVVLATGLAMITVPTILALLLS